MLLVIEQTVYIDEHEIVNSILNHEFDNVDDAVDEYVAGLDDCEYYAIGNEEIEKVKAKVKKMLKHIEISTAAQL